MTTSTHAVHVPVTWPARKLAALAVGGVGWFAVSVLALHFLRADLNPITQPTSAYAVGSFGWLMTTAFAGMSLGSWALILALTKGVPPAARSRMGLVLLGLWALGVLIAMTFPMDAEGAPPTLAGAIHQTNGFIVFLCLTLGVFLVSRRLTAAAGWRSVGRTMAALSVLLLLEYAAMAVGFATDSTLVGLGQRIYLATFITWFVLTAAQLRSGAG
jgi:hypothetical protein